MQQSFLKSLTLLVLWLLSPAAVHAQPQTYTPAQLERVAKLSELYGHIKFFHPYLGYKRINWDSAFAQTAPRVAQAQTDAETVAAINQMLAVLRDGATTARLVAPRAKAAPGAASDSVRVYFAPDSVLVLQTNGYIGADDYEGMIVKVSTFAEKLPKARAVLLDLRGSRPLTEDQIGGFNYGLGYVGLLRLLSAQPLVTAATRLRNHSGFAPEDGGTSGGYWSGFYIRTGETTQPRKDSRNRPLAILVNKNAALSAGLMALGSHPHVRLYSTEPLSDVQLVGSLAFPFSPTIAVDFRTAELLGADGSLGLSGVGQLPAGTRPEAAAAYVLSQLRNPASASMARSAAGTTAALPAAPPPAVYPAAFYPALGYRLLAGAKMWSIIHYFHAYKDLMPTSWNAALRTALGQLAAAPDSAQYALAVARFYRHIQDGHGAISSPAIIRYVGQGSLPVDVQFVENKPVITRIFGSALKADMHVGDVITEINGEKVATRIARLAAIQAASNEWTRLNYLRWRLLRAPVGQPIRIGLRGADNRDRTITLTALPASQLTPTPDTTAVFRLLPGNIGYADMGRLQTKDVPRMFAAFKATKAVVFDMRNYPTAPPGPSRLT